MHFNISVTDNIAKLVSLSDLTINERLEVPQEKYGFNNKLNEQRNKIDKIHPETWKKVRWFINDFDFVVKDPIINRAFYKFWEILHEFKLFADYTPNSTIFHCAEAPGGFIQCSNIFLKLNKIPSYKTDENIDGDGFVMVKKRKPEPKNYRIYTISLNKDIPRYKSYNLPSYNKSIINRHVCITYGKDNTGDINNLENIDYVGIKTGSLNSFYMITATKNNCIIC